MSKGAKGANGDHAPSNHYPRRLLSPDGQALTLRLMGPADQDAVLAFARSLPSDDLLFLRTDITERGVIAEWAGNLAKGSTVSLIAEIEGKLVGYASLHNDQARWTRRVGEIRVLLGPVHRGTGLGRLLAEEIFNIGRARGI